MAHKFKPGNWERLVSAERRALLDPDRFVERLAIAPGDSVADIGAGPGFFTVPLADRVGATGTVYALDVAPQMIALLESRRLPEQVRILLSDEHRLPVPDASVDVALMAFVLHEVEDPQALLTDVRRILRPGGRLVVIEWTPQVEEMGPPMAERMSAAQCEATLSSAGFDVTGSETINASHYTCTAVPAGG